MSAAKEQRGQVFRYEGFEVHPERGELRCTYTVDDRTFTELIRVDAPSAAWQSPAVSAAARLVFLVAGVSYYKTAAPPIIDTGVTALTEAERIFLRALYVDGLAEFAFKNGIDLAELEIVGPTAEAQARGHVTNASSGQPLVPFGGGIDSIVVTELVRAACPDTALFVVSKGGDRFAAIEAALAVTGLPVIRAERELDPQVLRSAELGFLNGHVPVTAVISAVAVLAAALHGRDAVVMSNEWSASIATLTTRDGEVNHQWSKSLAFEQLFRSVLSGAVPGVDYFSALRPYSELWVALRFAALEDYHFAFRSCNRSFAIDPARRLDRWCGECDKCCFIDLILSPFLSAERLIAVFDGNEPLTNPTLEPKFRSLLGDPAHVKPFECVGEERECRAALLLAAERADRSGDDLLHRLADEVRASGTVPEEAQFLLERLGPHFINESYVDADVVV